PFGIFRLLWDLKIARNIKGLRILVLGVLEEYRNMGVDVLLYFETFKEGIRKGYTHGEMSWVLEDNVKMMRPIEALGARHYKTYRIYEYPL
ncbi:MAG: N-acetyltransferase, partial [Candidatus Bathyarchaeia archaeon]